jgi:hypothetical protein
MEIAILRSMSARSPIVRYVFGVIGVLLSLVLIAAVMARLAAPAWIEKKITEGVKDGCPQCEIKMGSVEISLLRGRVVFNDFRYEDSPDRHARVALTAKRLEISAQLESLIHKPLVIKDVRADEVAFTLTENPAIDSGRDDQTPPLSGLPPFVMEHLEVHQSSFHYVNLVKPQASSLLLTQVHGTVGAWSTRKEIASRFTPELTSIRATGVLENSGHFLVKADADPVSKQGTALIHIEVKDQELASVSEFFEREQGVQVQGRIFLISTDFKMTDGKIDGKLTASYFGLGVKVKDRNSSKLGNFLVTAGIDLVKKNEQGVNGEPPGEKPVEGERKPDQGLISAIFHALGPAATALIKG